MNNKSKILPCRVGVLLTCSKLYFVESSKSLLQCDLSRAPGGHSPLSHSISPRLKSSARNFYMFLYGFKVSALLRDKSNSSRASKVDFGSL